MATPSRHPGPGGLFTLAAMGPVVLVRLIVPLLEMPPPASPAVLSEMVLLIIVTVSVLFVLLRKMPPPS